MTDCLRPVGRPTGAKPRSRTIGPFRNEAEMCATMASDHIKWSRLVGAGPFSRVELEYQIPVIKTEMKLSRRNGLARVDLVCWRDDGTVDIVEAKTQGTPQDVMGGLGQLLHYKTLLELRCGLIVGKLVLATTHVPVFMDKTLEAINADVAVLHITGNAYFGYFKKDSK